MFRLLTISTVFRVLVQREARFHWKHKLFVRSIQHFLPLCLTLCNICIQDGNKKWKQYYIIYEDGLQNAKTTRKNSRTYLKNITCMILIPCILSHSSHKRSTNTASLMKFMSSIAPQSYQIYQLIFSIIYYSNLVLYTLFS